MNTSENVIKELERKTSKEKGEIYPKFFKTEEGGYGQGDIFWGITNPNIRLIAKRYYKEITFDDLKVLVNSPIHEIRTAGYIMLTYKYEKADIKLKGEIVSFYLKNLNGVNNWDIVDLTCYKILGMGIVDGLVSKDILYTFVKSKNMWERRISIVSTYAFIKRGILDDTIRLSKQLLDSKEDLIHKAVGWMLREVGKKDIQVLREFLNTNIRDIPRTTLRYSIEKMDENERRKYLKM